MHAYQRSPSPSSQIQKASAIPCQGRAFFARRQRTLDTGAHLPYSPSGGRRAGPPGPGELLGSAIPQGAVRSSAVVVVAPSFDLLPGIRQIKGGCKTICVNV